MSTKPPSGTRDFLPDDIRRREHVIGVVRSVYERYGFEPLETPAFENIETLLGKYGEESNKLIFKILRRGEHEASGDADLALRYDLTVPLARVIAQYQNELPRLFKRYQIQPVWRADRPAKGRFREFYQCDIDSTGSISPIVEVEQLAAVSEVLEELGFRDFDIRINHRRLLTLLLELFLDLPVSKHAEALVILDKLDRVGWAGVDEEFQRRNVLDPSKIPASVRSLMAAGGKQAWQTPLPPSLEGLKGALDVPSSTDGVVPAKASTVTLVEIEQLINQMAELKGVKDVNLSPIEELTQIERLSQATSAAKHLRFDPSLARGLSYYTGAIMEIAVTDLAGSLGGGGRYDHLIGTFLGRDIPACGFSLGLERIIVVMTERNMFPQSLVTSAVDVVVTFMDDESRSEALKLAGELRAQRLRAEVYPEASRKFDKALKHAASRGARIMAIFGENERAQGQVSVRDLQTRAQEGVPRSEATARIAARLHR